MRCVLTFIAGLLLLPIGLLSHVFILLVGRYPKTLRIPSFFQHPLLLATIVSLLASIWISPFPNLTPASHTSVNLISNPENLRFWSQEGATWLGTSFWEARDADCFRLEPGFRHRIFFQTTEDPAGKLFTASIFIKAWGSNHSEMIGLRIQNGSGKGQQTLHSLSDSWQRLTTSTDFSLFLGSSPTTLSIFNPNPHHDIHFCATGAQLEQSSSASPYTTLLSTLPIDKSPWRTRLLLTASLLAIIILLILIIQSWQTLSPSQLDFFYWGLVLGFACTIMIASIERGGFLVLQKERVALWSGHPNILGLQIVVCSLLLLQRKSSPMLVIVIILSTLLGIWSSGSRASLIAFTSGLLILSAKKTSRYLLWGGLVIAIVVLSMAIFDSSSSRLLVPFQSDDLARLCLFEASAELIGQRPLWGWGINSAADQLLRILWSSGTRYYPHAHNAFLQLGVEFGLITVGLMLWILLSSIVWLWKHNHISDAAPLVSIGIANLFDYTLGNPNIYCVVVIAVAILLKKRVAFLKA